MRARGGSITFTTARCEATDLCAVARDVAALKAKFDQ